jgi:hypothetical protein
MSRDPFRKGTPVKFTGKFANLPQAGSGIVSLSEIVVPLAAFNAPVKYGEELVFWPFLTSLGVKWGYRHTAYPEITMGEFENLT